jgi:hypothetical protein
MRNKDKSLKNSGFHDLIHEENLRNKNIPSILKIFKKNAKSSASEIKVPSWMSGLGALLYLLLFAILIAAVVILLSSKRPGVYLESCEKRSCEAGLDLKCIDGKCQCLSSQYYETKCIDKKTNNQLCQETNQCKDNTNLICYAGKCQCDVTAYWTGTICKTRFTYKQPCKGDQCQNIQMLYCDNKAGVCTCNSTRYNNKNLFDILKQNIK